jgi:hypothetical protein
VAFIVMQDLMSPPVHLYLARRFKVWWMCAYPCSCS